MMYDIFELVPYQERGREVKYAEGNRETGLSKQEKIPKGYCPRGEGQGQRPTEGKKSKK
jgi:hypothetical protein